MYAHFYHLSESPFNLTPDPKFHYVNESTREALASLLHGIRSRKGFITLIAEAGTGKTTMLKRVVEEVEGDTRVVFVFNPGVSFDELLEFICTELEIRTDSPKRLHLLERLNQYLLDQLTDGRNVVVMIDEAQTLEDSVLEELRLLTNLETSKEKILQIVLSGQPELEDKLRRPQLRQLRQRIGVRCTLKPMRADEIGSYVETRLRGAGAERSDFFTPVALRKVWSASGGIPRVINAVCDNAMMIAFAEGKHRIDSSVIKEAVRDLHGGDSGEGWASGLRDGLTHPYARYVAAAVVALAFIVPTALDLWRGWRNLSTQPQLASVSSDTSALVTQAARETVAAAASLPAADPGPPPVALREPVAATQPADEASVAASEAPQIAHEADLDPVVRAGRAVNRDGAFKHDDAVLATIRRAELMARSTAARIYEGRRRSLEDSANGVPDDRSASDAAQRARAGESERDESLMEVVGHQGFVGDEDRDATFEDERLAAEAAAAAAREAEEHAARELAAAKSAAEAAAKHRVAAEQRAQDQVRVAAEKAAAEQAAASKAAAEQAAAQKAAAEQAAAQKAAAEQAAAQKAAAEQAAADKTAAKEEPVRIASARGPENDGGDSATAADAKAERAQRLASVKATGPALGEVFVGRHVLVSPGETIWDIAIGNYGSAGASTVTRLLNNNPGVRDPRRLTAGAHVFVPFEDVEQMVRQDSDSTYRVLLTVTPLRSVIDEVRYWMEREGFEVTLGMATLDGTETTYHLYALGVATRAEARALAQRVLELRDVAGDEQQKA
jgi:type II secretory pathway predicted ATPase ExeA